MEHELFFPFANPSTQAAAHGQDQIGWSNLFLGQLAKMVLTPTFPLDHYFLPSHFHLLGY